MALEVFKCENCGARIPPPPSTVKMVVCEFCRNPGLNPFYAEPAAPAVPTAPAAPAAPAPPAPAQVRARTAEEVARLAQAHLKLFDALYYAPGIPPKKEQGARASYGAMIPADDPIVALFDATVFGGADDGFVITPRRLGWKNIADNPHVITWDVLDIRTVRAGEDDIKIMGDMIQVEASSELQGRLVAFLRAMAGAAPAQAAAEEEASEEDEEEEEEEYDAETVQSWIDDTLGFVGEHLRPRASLLLAPDIPPKKLHTARRAHQDSMAEDDTIVALYDPSGSGGARDGFAITPWGLFWMDPDEEPSVLWWEDVDMDTVVLEDGVLFIEDIEVQISDNDRGLPRELHRLIEAMADWAQS